VNKKSYASSSKFFLIHLPKLGLASLRYLWIATGSFFCELESGVWGLCFLCSVSLCGCGGIYGTTRLAISAIAFLVRVVFLCLARYGSDHFLNTQHRRYVESAAVWWHVE